MFANVAVFSAALLEIEAFWIRHWMPYIDFTD
jgi:hypothetical protein